MTPMYLSLVSVHVCSRPRPMLFHYPLAPPHGHPLCLKTLTMWVNSTNPLLSLSSSCSAGASTKPQCWESTAGRNHHSETRSLWRYIHSIQLCIYIWHTLIFLIQRGDIVYVIKDLGNDFCQGVCNNFYCTVPKYILVSHVNVWLYALYGISAYSTGKWWSRWRLWTHVTCWQFRLWRNCKSLIPLYRIQITVQLIVYTLPHW